jgi:hypothetical protein
VTAYKLVSTKYFQHEFRFYFIKNYPMQTSYSPIMHQVGRRKLVLQNPIVIKIQLPFVILLEEEIFRCVDKSTVCYWIPVIEGKDKQSTTSKFYYINLDHSGDRRKAYKSSETCD